MKKVLGFLFIVIGLGCIGGSFLLPKEEETVKKDDTKKEPESAVVQPTDPTNPTEEKWKDEIVAAEPGVLNYVFNDDLMIDFVIAEDMSTTAKIDCKGQTVSHKFHSGGPYRIYKIQNLYFFITPVLGQFGQSESILIINTNGETIREFLDYKFNGNKDGELTKDATTFEVVKYTVDENQIEYDEEGNQVLNGETHKYNIIDNNIEEIK